MGEIRHFQYPAVQIWPGGHRLIITALGCKRSLEKISCLSFLNSLFTSVVMWMPLILSWTHLIILPHTLRRSHWCDVRGNWATHYTLLHINIKNPLQNQPLIQRSRNRKRCVGVTGLPCWSLHWWLSSPSRSCWAAGWRCRRTPRRSDRGWRTWGGSRDSFHWL